MPVVLGDLDRKTNQVETPAQFDIDLHQRGKTKQDQAQEFLPLHHLADEKSTAFKRGALQFAIVEQMNIGAVRQMGANQLARKIESLARAFKRCRSAVMGQKDVVADNIGRDLEIISEINIRPFRFPVHGQAGYRTNHGWG